MKVIQLVMARQYRGAEIFALHLSRHLISLGARVKWVALYAPPERKLEIVDVDWTELNGVRGKFIDWKLLARLKAQVMPFQPDVLQANSGDTLKYAVMLKLRYGFKFKIVFRNASMVSQYMRSPWQRWVYQFLYRWVDQVVSVSAHSMRDFINTFPSLKYKIQVEPIGLGLNTPYQKRQEFEADVFHIMHVGGFTFEKNHEGLLRIFQMVQSFIPQAKLWLAGDGPLLEQTRERVNQMGLKNIVFLGSVTNPLDYIASAQVLVLPSLIEGLPGVMLEAMFCKIPVVAYDVGGISEVVRPGETGWLVKAGDEAAFVQAVVDVFQHDHIQVITNKAYELVRKEFDNQVIAENFLKVYESLC
jgi:L-malate glycosyltransferase